MKAEFAEVFSRRLPALHSGICFQFSNCDWCHCEEESTFPDSVASGREKVKEEAGGQQIVARRTTGVRRQRDPP
jgi:hypothetical protein